MRIVGGKKVMIPLYDIEQTITDATYDLTFLDTNDIQTWQGIENTKRITPATSFIAQTNTTIKLCASYCAVGYSRFTLDTGGYDVEVYDWMNNKLFDSSDYQGTKYEFECVANRSDRGLGLADNQNRYWTYDGTNHVWKIRPLKPELIDDGNGNVVLL